VRRFLRILGTLMIVAGAATLGWAMLVWQWQDPFTALVERYEQGKLESAYEQRAAQFRLPPAQLARVETADVRRAARRYRRALGSGEPIGVLTIGRLGLRKVVVNGTDSESLKKGPGRDARTFMPGQGKLVYIAGHRTTYGAPFSHIDNVRTGDFVRLEVPYATFVYRVSGHAVVGAHEIDRLRSRGHEEIALQACHPRFFASHRYIVYGKLVRVEPGAGARRAEAIAAP
jgi:sortase A